MSRSCDVIVVGAGHNGLTAACLLAGVGRRVLVLERGDEPGGLARGPEFHPGYRSPGLFHDTTGLNRRVVEQLGLVRLGLRPRANRPDLLAVASDGTSLRIAGDRRVAAEEIARRSQRDAERYLRFHEFLDRVRGVLRQFTDEPPIDIVALESARFRSLLRRAWRLRRLGRNEMAELLRIPPMCVADWLDEWFETDLLKAALAMPAIAHTFTGPRSPGSAANLLIHEGAAGPGTLGGGPALIAALLSRAGEAGVEIRTGSNVSSIDSSANGGFAVSLNDGETFEASRVAASCDPKQLFLQILPAGAIPDRLERRIGELRARGTTAQLLLALDSPVAFAGDGARRVEHACFVDSLTGLEQAHDAVKYRRCSETPALELYLPPADAGLAPTGGAVASVLIHFAPHHLQDGWDDGTRETLATRVIETVERRLPGISSQIVGHRILCPATIESLYGVSGGHPYHVEHSLDQLLVRPAPGCVSYRTPVEGLFLCGSGSHPGGGLTCTPGALAAAAVLDS
jgi:phytoene dehydrogenase-like protein